MYNVKMNNKRLFHGHTNIYAKIRKSNMYKINHFKRNTNTKQIPIEKHLSN